MNNADISNLIYGVAVDDAMGFPVQFYKQEQVKSFNVTGMITHKGGMFPAGTWSDDTSLTLALVMLSILLKPHSGVFSQQIVTTIVF